MRSNCSLRFTFALFASVVLGQAAHAQIPTTRFVATNSAFNGTGCGSRERPCRTIVQAVKNAADGDLIEVGPGTYSGTIVIDKAVEIYSTAGAALTLIRDPDPFQPVLVTIRVSGVKFGRLNGGFTIVGTKENLGGGSGTGGIDGGGGGITDTTIVGNILEGHTVGISISGATGVRLEGNAAIDNVDGFQILAPPEAITNNVVINNVALDNVRGFLVYATGTTFTSNAAIGNEVGIEAGSEYANELSGNTIIGNSQTGFHFRIPPLSAARIVLHNNNIYGNGDAADGCGVINESGGVINATNNYWGKADGPGPNPGDRAYGACSVRGSIVTTPFATTAFPAAPVNAQ